MHTLFDNLIEELLQSALELLVAMYDEAVGNTALLQLLDEQGGRSLLARLGENTSGALDRTSAARCAQVLRDIEDSRLLEAKEDEQKQAANCVLNNDIQ